VGNGFFNFAPVNNQNLIGIAYGGEAVGNNDGSAVFHQGFEGFLKYRK
jgi:hypothetical protein